MNETVETPAVETAVAEPQVEPQVQATPEPAPEAAEPQVETPQEVSTTTEPSQQGLAMLLTISCLSAYV